ncbi:MAG: outer membrane lipoprotein-sorting protein [Candidatus Omnitrophica bacterium]|nr:outer membrane lipoprotein-sorting protein [Candidatus Omnitrophota bacterium]
MKNGRYVLFAIVFQSFFFVGMVGASSNINPSGILQKIDEIRSPNEDFSLVARVSSFKSNHPPQTALYDIRMQGREKTIVRTLQPANERGRVILMRDNDYWFFFPEVSQPLHVASQERFLGDISNGDIARINFFADYDGQFLREESSNEKKYYVLELKAKSSKVTYGKVILWVEQKNFWPLKAEFYGVSGRFLKICSYENYKMLAGKMRPSRLVLSDAVIDGQYSVIEYDKIEVGRIENKYFTREYLKKMVY